MKRIILLLCATLFALSTYSQSTYTEKLRKNEAGKGTVVIRQSDEIERIVNGTQKPRSASKVSTSTTKNDASANSGSTSHASHTSATATHTSHPSTDASEKKESARKSSENKSKPTQKHNTASDTSSGHRYISRARHKARGFRICIFTGGNSRADKIKAIQMGNKCREKFRELAVYPSFEAPRWVTHVGDFKTRQEAQKYVVRIRRAHISYEVRIVASEVNIPY